MSETLVQLQNISQIYGRRKSFTAVKDVKLSVQEGEFVALLGPSGCGKTTLLRIITGLLKPSEGESLYRGEQLSGVNRHASVVFQTFSLFPWLTVQQNVEVALKARGIPGKIRTPRAVELLDRVGLDGFETAYPRELSGGMRQKVGFARAMAMDPELLCLDEPFSGLDVLSAESLRGELLELWVKGRIPTKAILMVTHSIEEAVFMADRIIVMDKNPGRVVAEIRVALPHPRVTKSPRFVVLVDRVYATLAGQTQPEYIEMGTAPGEPGETRSLPIIPINSLVGLIEHLDDEPNSKADIYMLAQELQLDSDQLLRHTEAAELLGFATIHQGDITLTTLGETFAEANILARKEMFATRLRRLPLFRWLTKMLVEQEKRELSVKAILEALEEDFPPEVAEKQLETAVDWGRYAEVLSYDDASEVVYLESA